MNRFITRLACLLSGHRRVLASMRLADGRLMPVALCERCGAAVA